MATLGAGAVVGAGGATAVGWYLGFSHPEAIARPTIVIAIHRRTFNLRQSWPPFAKIFDQIIVIRAKTSIP
jgi:hypothetical protein